jgi:hypothetical protein
MRDLSYHAPPALPIATGATTPSPGVFGPVVWSTIDQRHLTWNGTSWVVLAPALSSASPPDITTVASAGTSALAARADHIHDHGAQTDPAAHALATPTADGFMPAADKAFIEAINEGFFPLIRQTPTITGGSYYYTGQDRLYSANLANRSVLAIDPGDDGAAMAQDLICYQPAEFSTRNRLWSAVTPASTTPALTGMDNTVIGGAAARSLTYASPATSACRIGYATAAFSGTSAGTRSSQGILMPKLATANAPAWFFHARFSLAATSSVMRFFVGIGATAALGNADPTAGTNLFGLSANAADSTFSVLCRSQKTLIAGFSKTSTNVIDFCMHQPKNSSRIYYSYRNGVGLLTAGWASTFDDLDISVTALLAPQCWINSGTAATSVAVDLHHMYLETEL